MVLPLSSVRKANGLFGSVARFVLRFRYPVSLPEDLAEALGMRVPNTFRFHRLLDYLTNPARKVGNLYRYMPRDLAEEMFTNAVRKERFQQRSLYSYYFDGTWMEFVLHFDERNRLRRVYLQHRCIEEHQGIELCLGEMHR